MQQVPAGNAANRTTTDRHVFLHEDFTGVWMCLKTTTSTEHRGYKMKNWNWPAIVVWVIIPAIFTLAGYVEFYL